jgi:negative regulator of sigma E activity
MKTPLSGAALASLVAVLGLASAGCTSPDDAQPAAGAGVARAQAAPGRPVSLYPPIQQDAADGQVHEYH